MKTNANQIKTKSFNMAMLFILLLGLSARGSNNSQFVQTRVRIYSDNKVTLAEKVYLERLSDTLDLETAIRHIRKKPNFDRAQAIKKYAPEVRLYPGDSQSGDEYRPSSVDWYLSRVHMRFDIKGQPDLQVLRKGNGNQQTLINQSIQGQHSGKVYKSSFFLQIPNDAMEKTTRQGESDVDKLECYAHFRPTPPTALDNGFDIQYWFFTHIVVILLPY